MNRISRTFVAGLAAGTLLFTAGCGSSGSGSGDEVSKEGRPYKAALKRSLLEGDDAKTGESNDVSVDEKQADCISGRWVNIMKPERLKKAGISPSELAGSGSQPDLTKLNLSEKEGADLYGAFDGCGVNLREEFLKSMESSSSSMTDKQKSCMADAIDDKFIRDLFVTAVTKGDKAQSGEATGKLMAAASKCGLMGGSGSGGSGSGGSSGSDGSGDSGGGIIGN